MKKTVDGVLLAGRLVAGPAGARASRARSSPRIPRPSRRDTSCSKAGIDYAQDVTYPVSGLRGNLWRIGTFGLSFGVSSIAEIQLDGGVPQSPGDHVVRSDAPLADMLNVTGDADGDFEDLTIGTKVRFLSETRRAARDGRALLDAAAECRQRERPRASTRPTSISAWRLPRPSSRCASPATSGSGSSPIRCAAIVRTTCFDYGVSVARAVAPGAEIVGEFNGRLNTAVRRAAARHREPVAHAGRRAVHARAGPGRRRADRRHHRTRSDVGLLDGR